MGLALAIPLIFGGLSPNSPIYQRSIAIGQFAAKMSAEQAAAQEAACMNGSQPDALRAIKVKGKLRDLFADYWKQVQGGKPATVSSLFHSGLKPGWATEGGTRLANPGGAGLVSDGEQLVGHVDPFVARGLKLDEVRINFVLAGDQKSAIGQWAVLNAAGQIAGLYDATFIPRKKAWKLTRLQWTGDSIGFRPPRQYCHAPDDVMPHRLASARAARIAAEEALVKAEARRAQAEAELAAAKGEQLQALAQQTLDRARQSEAEARAAASDSAFALAASEREAEAQKASDDRALHWDAQRGT